jgi:hypothetical protein
VKAWAGVFLALAGFGLGLGTLYYALTQEWVGSTLLWVMGLMPLVVVGYAANRGAFRSASPADDPSASPADAAGEDLGEFPAASAWPLFMVLGVAAVGCAVVYGLILFPIGIGAIGWAAVGLMRESRG